MAGKSTGVNAIRTVATCMPSLGTRGGIGQIIRQKDPKNLEFPFSALDSFTTPNELFYIRNHFSQPAIDVKDWTLKVEGLVQQEMQFTLDELKELPPHTRMATLECAGNSRIFLVPKVNGAQWELGAVSNAEWTGVKLSDVLAKVGVLPEATELVFEGADTGQPDDPPRPAGKIHYSHAIPLSKADDVLLAFEMNGKPLPLSHGFPLRAIVGGWYGMASVKWLSRIVASNQPFHGYFQTIDYAYWSDRNGMPVRVPISEMQVKSQISRPALHEIIPSKTNYRVTGAAWSGDSEVARVEISTDDGQTFSDATLLGPSIRHTWRFWEFSWTTPSSPGTVILMARATDAAGHTQPSERNPDLGSYVISHTLPVEVEIR